MYAAGLLMVLVQYFATFGIVINMVNPTCSDSNQCPRGQFCYKFPGEPALGRCLFCAKQVPLAWYTTLAADGATEQKWNRVCPRGLGDKEGVGECVNYLGFNLTQDWWPSAARTPS